MPTLIHDNATIWDSLAILRYLAERPPNIEMGARLGGAGDRPVNISGDALRVSGFARELLYRGSGSGPRRAPYSYCRIGHSSYRCHLARLPGAVWLRRPVSDWPILSRLWDVCTCCLRLAHVRRRSCLLRRRRDGAALYVEKVFAVPEMEEWADQARTEVAAAE